MTAARLGLSVATRAGMSAAAVGTVAADAEWAGFTDFFVAERVADALPLCQAAAAATGSIGIGTAVLNARPRHPALTALGAAAIDELSGGRFSLGLGTANPGLNEATLGLPPVRPVPFMREYVETVRRVLTGAPDPQPAADPVGYGLRGLVPDRPPARPGLPILLAAMLPRMLALAGAVADGVLLSLITPATLAGALREVAAGAAAAGRSPADVLVGCVLPCCLTEDAERSGRAGRELVVGYAQHPAAARLFAASGFAAELAGAAALLAAGDRAAALAAVTDEMVDAFLLRGGTAAVTDRLERYRAAGVALPILFPLADGDGDWPAAIKQTVEVAAGGLVPTSSRGAPA